MIRTDGVAGGDGSPAAFAAARRISRNSCVRSSPSPPSVARAAMPRLVFSSAMSSCSFKLRKMHLGAPRRVRAGPVAHYANFSASLIGGALTAVGTGPGAYRAPWKGVCTPMRRHGVRPPTARVAVTSLVAYTNDLLKAFLLVPPDRFVTRRKSKVVDGAASGADGELWSIP